MVSLLAVMMDQSPKRKRRSALEVMQDQIKNLKNEIQSKRERQNKFAEQIKSLKGKINHLEVEIHDSENIIKRLEG